MHCGVSRFNFGKIKNELSSIRAPPSTFGTHRDRENLIMQSLLHIQVQSGPIRVSRSQSEPVGVIQGQVSSSWFQWDAVGVSQ